MFRPFLCILCLFAFALQILVIAGCGSSTPKTNNQAPPADREWRRVGKRQWVGKWQRVGEQRGGTGTDGAITGVWLQSPLPGQNPSHVQVTCHRLQPQ